MSPVVLADSGTATKIFVLDTNVLMHDPSALFRFQEHHVYLPMTVLEELDNAKLGVSEVARNVRQTNRFIDELLTAQKEVVIEAGLQLNKFTVAEEPYRCSGRLYSAQGSSQRSRDNPDIQRYQSAYQGHNSRHQDRRLCQRSGCR
jgi:predicted ribonuclease YlaK